MAIQSDERLGKAHMTKPVQHVILVTWVQANQQRRTISERTEFPPENQKHLDFCSSDSRPLLQPPTPTPVNPFSELDLIFCVRRQFRGN